MNPAALLQAPRPARARTGDWRAWVVALVLVPCLEFLAPRAGGADVVVAKEHQIKAAFLYNFTKFVEWPAKAFSATNAPFVIGVVGDGPLCVEIGRVIKGRNVNGRELVVRSIETPEAAREVHMLFLCGSVDDRLAEYLNPNSTANILTVGESDRFARQGGAIEFLLDADKVRFDIDTIAAERAGLKVSAQLLKLARTVRSNK